MKAFWKENWRLLVCTILALCAGILIGMYIGINLYSKAALQTRTATHGATDTVQPDTVILLHVEFMKCGHENTVLLDNTPYLGMSEAQMRQVMTDEMIEGFSSKHVYLSAEREGYCPDHIVLKKESGKLCVYRTKSSSLTKELLYKLNLDTVVFSPTEQTMLKEGIVFDTLSEVNAFLESAES